MCAWRNTHNEHYQSDFDLHLSNFLQIFNEKNSDIFLMKKKLKGIE